MYLTTNCCISYWRNCRYHLNAMYTIKCYMSPTVVGFLSVVKLAISYSCLLGALFLWAYKCLTSQQLYSL
ncbi:hypothetical protein DITRI_Ditri08aG0077300 [Diplodiscus trichospermus]